MVLRQHACLIFYPLTYNACVPESEVYVTAPKPVPEPSLFPELNMFLGVPNYPPRVSRIVGNAGAELAG